MRASSPRALFSTAGKRRVAVHRGLKTSTPLLQAQPRFDYEDLGKVYTTDDLQGIPAEEILAETGTYKDTKMRHFTGPYSHIF